MLRPGRGSGGRDLNARRNTGSGHLQPELAFQVLYHLALADYRDYNVADARRKLTALPQDSSALWTEQVHDLQLKIEERNRLDFKELRRRHQAVLALNLVNF